jgi:hypothetical protein
MKRVGESRERIMGETPDLTKSSVVYFVMVLSILKRTSIQIGRDDPSGGTARLWGM